MKTGTIFRRRTLKPSRSLFHYTSAQGLIGIIQDQTLHATHTEFSNDTTECKLIVSLVAPVIEPEYREIIPALIERRAMSKEALELLRDDIIAGEAAKTIGALSKAASNIAPFFSTSFCIHEKENAAYSHGLLSQWRSYARGGFAIEFDEAELDKLCSLELAGSAYTGFRSDVVHYSNHATAADPAQFKGLVGAMFHEAFDTRQETLNDILGSKTVGEFVEPFLKTAPFLKHPSFSEENEYRIAVSCNRTGKVEPGEKRPTKDIKFRSRPDGNVIPYICLFDNPEWRLPIKAVIVGPNSRQENQKVAVELLLEKHNVAAEIRLSEIPYRE